MLVDQSGRQREFLDEATSSLQALIQAHERIDQEARETTERADARVASLREADAALHRLIETHKQIEHAAREAVQRAETYQVALRESLESGEPLLNEFRSRIGALDVRLTRLGERSAEIERKIGEGTAGAKAVVENAQAQAEHLERVCTAVRKVFAGLSQTSLQAKEQTDGLQKSVIQAESQMILFAAESKNAEKILHEWLQEALRVQARLERTLDQSPSVAQTHPVESLRSVVHRLGPVERSATIRIEDEPGAAKAREVDAGIDRLATREPASRADEIARLIAEAKNARAQALVPN